MYKLFFIRTLVTICAIFIFHSSVYAQSISFGEPITAPILVNIQSNLAYSYTHVQPRQKTVTLMNIQLTKRQKRVLQHYHSKKTNTMLQSIFASTFLPDHVNPGMNKVPVLDQGSHGSCVTFANTAAIDALLNKGDYISQLCQLELGYYFEKNGYLPSGWNGSFGSDVLNQILGFGIINKNNQKMAACGELIEYPVNDSNIGNPISLENFKLKSENLRDTIFWEPLLTFFQRFRWDMEDSSQADILLQEVKNMLTHYSYDNIDARVTFGVILPTGLSASAHCSAGACARYHVDDDTWALSDTIINAQNIIFAGHEMVITGYDNNAIAIDNNGTKHQGLLFLRNSWGSDAGDQGNYYMTYDFFKQFVFEVQGIMAYKEIDSNG